MASLLESLSSTLTPDALGSIAKALGADPGAVSKGLGAVGPLLLGGLGQVTATPGGAEAMFKSLPADSGGMLGGLGSLVGSLFGGGGGGAGGGSIVNQLLGSGSNAIGASLSRALGFNVTPLIAMAAPLLMNFLSKAVKGGNLDASGLASMVAKEQAAVAANPANAEALALVQSATEAGQQASALIDSYGADWAKVSLGPLAATMLVTGSDLSGPIDSMKEVKAANQAMVDAAAGAGPASVLASALGGGIDIGAVKQLRELVRDKGKLIDLVKGGAAAVALRSPGEAAAYKATVLKVAQATAEAAKDGGFLGIGGKLVSDDEQAALDALKAALA